MYPEQYLAIRSLILSGDLNGAANLLSQLQQGSLNRSHAKLDPVWIRLLNTRLSLKSGQINTSMLMEASLYTESSVLAEIEFLNGLIHFNLRDHAQGSQAFSRAETHYQKLGDTERVLMSRFNATIGAENLEQPEESLEARVDRFRGLKRLAFEARNLRVLGLCARQLSMIFYQDGRYRAALDEAKVAVTHLELYGVLSDHHNALLQAAVIALKLGEIDSARVSVEKIVGLVEERNRFAWEYVHAVLHHRPLPNPLDFERSCPYFLKILSTEVPANNGASEAGNDFSSMEEQLLFLIRREVFHRDYLCHALWPESIQPEIKLNRLHRLINRLKTKLKDVQIECVKGIYRIRPTIS